MRLPLITILQIAFLAASSAAQAATATATFNAHVKIVASCTSTATALDFGTLPGLITGTETTTSTLTVTCSKGAAYTMALSAGSGSMAGQTVSTEKVNYNAMLAATGGTGSGAAQTYSITGALPALTGTNVQTDYGYSSIFLCSSFLSGRAKTVPFTVRTTNRITCNVSATSLDFGSQSALTSAVNTTNTISLTCSSGTAYTVGLNNGNSGGTGPAARIMANAGTTDKVTYGIYLDAARSQAWGDGTMGGVASGTGNGTAQSFTGYGRIPAQTSPSAFDYNDTVVVTVTY